MDFLPYYYREADTYKVSGKGILERYLEIFGNYFEDYIVKDTTNILDILDIDKCPEMYLNYLWEFLGQMPFAYGNKIDPDKWKAYYNGFASNSEMTKLAKVWIIPKTEEGKFNLSTATVRKLLKYSVSLFKIRGTQRFFEILFRIYGLTCTIGLPEDKELTDEEKEEYDYYGTDTDYYGTNDDYAGRALYSSRYCKSKADTEDAVMDGNYNLDKSTVCTRCMTIPVTITGHGFSSDNVNNDSFIQFQRICEAIFDRFLPYNVHASINYSFTIPCTYHIETYLLEGDEWVFLKSDTKSNATAISQLYLQDGVRKELQVKVLVSRSYRNEEGLTFRTGSSATSYGEAEHVSGYIVHVRKSGNLYFQSVNANSNGSYTSMSINVTRKESIRYYNIGYTPTEPENLNISITKPSVTVKITSTVRYGDTTYPVNIRLLNTGQILEVDSQGVYNYVFKKPGEYTFAMVDFPIKQITIAITRDPEIFNVTCNPNTASINVAGQVVKTMLTISRSYEEPKVMAIQAMSQTDTLLSVSALEKLWVQDPDYETGPNKNIVLSNTYAMGSIPLIKGQQSYPPSKNIGKFRFCCIKNPVRETSQYINIRIYTSNKVNGSMVTSNEFTKLFPSPKYSIHMNDGYIDENGEIVNDPNWQYSDWIDVTDFLNGTSYLGAISRLEYHLNCSLLTCYEINNPITKYNCGEYFKTQVPGTYVFRATEDTDKIGGTGQFKTTSAISSDVRFSIKVTPKDLMYLGDTDVKKVRTQVIVQAINLTQARGIEIDTEENPLDTGFSIYEFTDYVNNHKEAKVLKSIFPNDKGWSVNTNSSLYEKQISVEFDSTTFPSGSYILVLNSWSSSNAMPNFAKARVDISNYIAPDTKFLYLKPTDVLNAGWVKPNWGTANLDDSSNTPADAEYDLIEGKINPSFQILVQQGGEQINSSMDLALYRVVKGEEHDTGQRYQAGSTINNIYAEGTYRFKPTSESAEYAQLTIKKDITYNITCTPVVGVLNEANYAVTRVTASANADVPSSNLQVKLITDTVWHDNGYSYIGYTPGIYNFHVRGDQAKQASFTIMEAGSVDTSPDSLTFESNEASKPIEITADTSTEWTATIEDS